jgi:hypothetical protein
VTHSYSTPSSYVATLTSCDRYGACASATTSVAIRKRAVTVGYLGDFSGTYNTPSPLSGSLTDEFGNAVAGRILSFSYNGAFAGSASANSSGVASYSFVPTLAAGTYPVSATFAGDSLYQGATGAGTYVEARKATSVTYTGALAGGPNKTVTLSAVLKDATGTALANRTVTFVLGSQSVTAQTDSNGIAATPLKLNQKNGVYALSATFQPGATDANLYVGSSASASFNLRSR